MNVERNTVGTKKSRQPKRQKSLELVQSRQSLTTVRQEVREAVCIYASVVVDRWWQGRGVRAPTSIGVGVNTPQLGVNNLVLCVSHLGWLSRTAICFATAGGYTVWNTNSCTEERTRIVFYLILFHLNMRKMVTWYPWKCLHTRFLGSVVWLVVDASSFRSWVVLLNKTMFGSYSWIMQLGDLLVQ